MEIYISSFDGFWLPAFRSQSGSVEEFSSRNLSQNEPILKSSPRKLHNQGNLIRKSIPLTQLEAVTMSYSRLNIFHHGINPSTLRNLRCMIAPVLEAWLSSNNRKVFPYMKSNWFPNPVVAVTVRRLHRRVFRSSSLQSYLFERFSSFVVVRNEENFVLRNCEAQGENNDFVDEKRRCFQSRKLTSRWVESEGVSRLGFLLSQHGGFSQLFFI